MNEGLAQMFRYNRWANGVLFDACAALSRAQLAAIVPGTDRSIEATFRHIISAQDDFLWRLHSGDAEQAARAAGWWQPPARDFGDFRDGLQRSSDALLTEAEGFEGDGEVPLPPFQGVTYLFPSSFLLLHALSHGIEHRSQICTTLAGLGVATPDLDGWGYAAANGIGRPAP